MTLSDWIGMLPVILSASVGAVLFHALVNRFWPGRTASMAALPAPPNAPVFLFEDDELVDASSSGSQLIGDRPDGMTERDALFRLLAADFPTLATEFADLLPGQNKRIVPFNGNPLTATLSCDGMRKRITLGALDGEDVDVHYATLARTAFGDELALLRDLTSATPQLIWREDDQGNVIWANRTYLTYSDRCADSAEQAQHVWPGRRLFADLAPGPADDTTVRTSRFSLRFRNEASEHWFDITSVPTPGGTAHFASDANAVVKAENTRREYMQTLGKTFAHLSVGLAIFDRKRQLTMFNPALLDMVGLPFEFLSARPTIEAMLNRMREIRRLPEPKNFASWRDQFLKLQAEAERGTYNETWNLPDGQTYRVSGKPHIDGALAFVFEDISAEVSLTRHFRTELETSQAVIDSLPEAIAVFSNANTLVITNRAYREMWGIDEDDVMQPLDLRASMRLWRTASVPSPIWPRLEEFAHSIDVRSAWSDTITLLDGRHARCHAQPLTGRMTMVKFSMVAPDRSALKSLSRPFSEESKLAER